MDSVPLADTGRASSKHEARSVRTRATAAPHGWDVGKKSETPSQSGLQGQLPEVALARGGMLHVPVFVVVGDVVAVGRRQQPVQAQRHRPMVGKGILAARRQVGSQLVLTYRQQWEGYPLFSCLVSLHWQGDQLLLVEGQMLKGAAATTRNSPLLSTPAILVRFLEGMNQGGYVCSRIDTMTPGYLSSGLTSSVQLTPVWQLTTDTGTYFIDALTGVFTAAS